MFFRSALGFALDFLGLLQVSGIPVAEVSRIVILFLHVFSEMFVLSASVRVGWVRGWSGRLHGGCDKASAHLSLRTQSEDTQSIRQSTGTME